MKNVLVMNFFPAFYPPTSGGELRYYNMYKGLSRYYDVTLLSPTYNDAKEEVITHSDTFREYRVPKEDIHNQLHWSIAKENICSEISALVCCLSAGTKNRYHEVYMQLYPSADIIIHEFPYMLHYDLFFGLDNKPRVYNSHNFESNLVSQMWSGPNAQKYLSVIQQAEGTLVRECELVFATSEEERDAFSKTYGRPKEKILLAPNGIDVALYEALRDSRDINRRKKAFFIGSAHPPNLEAVRFLLDEVAPVCSDVDFCIAGKCSVNMTTELPNVRLMGLIDDKQKDELFATSDVAVNPMFSGAGTNLKTLEFLSAGIPMISTYVGVRGLDLREDVHYVHAESKDFSNKLEKMLDQPQIMKMLAENGKSFINARYSWESICGVVHSAIDGLDKKQRNKPAILALNDYPVDQPVAGGEVRIHYLLKYLSQDYRIVYLCLNNRNAVEKREICEDFVQISLPKTLQHIDKEKEVNAKCWISANDIVAGNMIRENRLFTNVAKTLYAQSDFVILEHPYLVDSLDGMSGKTVIYESHNYETGLKRTLLEPHPMKQWLCAETERLEKKAIGLSSVVVCCSDDEVSDMAAFAERPIDDFSVVRNGVEFAERKYNYKALRLLFGGKPIVVFVGSAHSPNIDAAAFIVRGLARETPQVAYVIIGSVCDAFQKEKLADNVVLMGRLPAKYKDYLLYAADIALNPVNEGAGSNLKLAEYFAFGIPTITTPFGARGYGIENGVHALICEREQFTAGIASLLSHRLKMRSLSKQACQYAKAELSWEHLAGQYKEIIKGLKSKKQLLFVTYRYNQPTRGGAEVYADNVLTEICKNGNYAVTIAATEIGDIINHYHYSCNYTLDRETAFPENKGLHVVKFPIDELSDEEKWSRCHTIFGTMMMESVELARQFTDVYQQPVLMGGWHYPEVSEEGVHIWSSGKAEIYLGNASAVKINGSTSQRKKIRLLLDDRQRCEQTVSGEFSFTLEKLKGHVLSICMNAEGIKGVDARPLGVNVHSVRYLSDNVWHTVNLQFDFRHVLSEKVPSDYVEAMIAMAKRRAGEIDELFYQTRGPVSQAMERWLEQNIERFDIVIGHSTPFDTLVLGQRIAKAHSVPFIALPHYHMEDTFYHWNLYYNALSNADRVIAAPAISKEAFFDKIGAKAAVLPGGGVFPEEFTNTGTSLFRSSFTLNSPFILTLGRKAGGKNYQWVIEAVEEVNRNGTPLQLVMIGRDDDKLAVDSPYVEYLGEQPREMVLSALKSCQFVVNMSESESFGIVILEAWLSGKTVIVNQGCAAFRELVEDGVNGLLSSRENLPDRIMELLQRNDLDTMAQKGFEKAKNYSWSRIAKEIEELCDEAQDGN